MMKVCIGGTFNVFHKGHKHLFQKAFDMAGEEGIVYIGVTKGKILQDKKFVKSYKERVEIIQNYLKNKSLDDRYELLPIIDKYGLAVKEEYDAIIVSPETVNNAEEINIKRVELGKKPLRITLVPYILADDNKPISSTRILEKEIDENGRILQLK